LSTRPWNRKEKKKKKKKKWEPAYWQKKVETARVAAPKEKEKRPELLVVGLIEGGGPGTGPTGC